MPLSLLYTSTGLLDCLLAIIVMKMPMMTLAFRISIRWKYMYQDVERV